MTPAQMQEREILTRARELMMYAGRRTITRADVRQAEREVGGHLPVGRAS